MSYLNIAVPERLTVVHSEEPPARAPGPVRSGRWVGRSPAAVLCECHRVSRRAGERTRDRVGGCWVVPDVPANRGLQRVRSGSAWWLRRAPEGAAECRERVPTSTLGPGGEGHRNAAYRRRLTSNQRRPDPGPPHFVDGPRLREAVRNQTRSGRSRALWGRPAGRTTGPLARAHRAGLSVPWHPAPRAGDADSLGPAPLRDRKIPAGGPRPPRPQPPGEVGRRSVGR